MRRGAIIGVLASGLVAGAAGAETEAASWGIGIRPAHPEDSAGLGEGVDVTAVVLNERTGQPAAVVEQADTLRLVAQVAAVPGAGARKLRLTCTVDFVGADGVQSEATEGPCFSGSLGGAAAGPKRLNLTLRFQPSPEDLAGTAGIKLHLWDAETGDEAILVPTYEWRGGR
jgi:hypothetical protein